MKIMAPYLVMFLLLSFFVACASNQAKQINQQPPGLAQNAESSLSPTPTVFATPQSVALPGATPQPADWHGGSKNFSIAWTGDNIVVTNTATKQEVFSARKFAAHRLRTAYKFMFNKQGAPDFLDFYFRYKLMGIAGSIMFLKETTSYSPASYTRETYLAIDLKTPRKMMSLKEFYAPEEILAALLGNEEIKRDFQTREEPPTETPKTLDDFLAYFHTGTDGDSPTEASDSLYDKCWFPPDSFDSFAFIQVEQNKVVAELGVPCRGDGMREDKIRVLKLTLPVSAAVKTALAGEIVVIKADNQNQETSVTFFVPWENRKPEDKRSIKIRLINDLQRLSDK